MNLPTTIRAAALEMAKEEGIDRFSTILLAMMKGANIALNNTLSAKVQHVCSDCGACQEETT